MAPGNYSNPLFRPPAEANSLILQTDLGCPHNTCTFCGMYRGISYQRLSLDSAEAMIVDYARRYPDARRIFLADGDVLSRPFSELKTMLAALNESFPRLARVSLYANGSSINRKTDAELRELQSLKLHTLYMGLESGDEDILLKCRKGETAEEMVAAGVKAQAAGLRMSVMVLLGLGSIERTKEHALHTAEVLNRMQPRLLSMLRVIPVPGTPLCDDAESGQFKQLTEYGVVAELRDLVSRLELDGTVFRANHSSNVASPEGRFPRNKGRILNDLDDLMNSDLLDSKSPGPMPLSL